MADLALLGMAGSATAAVFTATAFVINAAVKFGRHLQRIDGIDEKVGALDMKVERHLQWHESELQQESAE